MWYKERLTVIEKLNQKCAAFPLLIVNKKQSTRSAMRIEPHSIFQCNCSLTLAHISIENQPLVCLHLALTKSVMLCNRKCDPCSLYILRHIQHTPRKWTTHKWHSGAITKLQSSYLLTPPLPQREPPRQLPPLLAYPPISPELLMP